MKKLLQRAPPQSTKRYAVANQSINICYFQNFVLIVDSDLDFASKFQVDLRPKSFSALSSLHSADLNQATTVQHLVDVWSSNNDVAYFNKSSQVNRWTQDYMLETSS